MIELKTRMPRKSWPGLLMRDRLSRVSRSCSPTDDLPTKPASGLPLTSGEAVDRQASYCGSLLTPSHAPCQDAFGYALAATAHFEEADDLTMLNWTMLNAAASILEQSGRIDDPCSGSLVGNAPMRQVQAAR